MVAHGPASAVLLPARNLLADRFATWLQTATALGSALAAVWQRLLFEGTVALPPPVLVATFWALLLLSLALHQLSGASERRALAWLTLAAAADYLWNMGLPRFGIGPEAEEYRWRLAGFLSTSHFGLPSHALLAAAGILAWTWLCTRSTPIRFVGLGSSIVFLLFGATTVLGYATGSPWPFGS